MNIDNFTVKLILALLLIGLIPDANSTLNFHPVTNGCGSSLRRISVRGEGDFCVQMKIIPLLNFSEGALVDDADFESLSPFRWRRNAQGYASLSNGGRMMHRIIMNPPIGFHTDHIDGNQLNNQRGNLRIATPSQNCANSRKPIFRSGPTSSRYKGVSFFKRDDNWMAYIMVNRKRIFIGYYNAEIEAANAYNNAAARFFGEFARLNPV